MKVEEKVIRTLVIEVEDVFYKDLSGEIRKWMREGDKTLKKINKIKFPDLNGGQFLGADIEIY